MSLPQPRYDAYGKPLQPLVDARQEVMSERPHNIKMRAFIGSQLETKYRELLRRGIYAKVTVAFVVKDGMIRQEIQVDEFRQWVAEDDAP